MNRLFTFGCSFTNYLWPTWADILATEYPLNFNWGHAGLGNRAIAERVAEAHSKFKFGPDDLVIVQWTSHLRHDWMNTKIPPHDQSNWRTKGSIFSKENQKVFDKAWMETFWDERAYYIHTLNNIVLTQGLLNSTGCQWYMTSMTDMGKISTEVSPATVDGEIPGTDTKLYDVWEHSKELLDYKEMIWDNNPDKWVEPIIETCNATLGKHWMFKHDLKNEKGFNVHNGMWMEPHPSVEQHALWLLKLKEKMGVEAVLTEAEDSMVKEFTKYKEETETYKELEARISETFWYQTRRYRGI